MFQFVKFCVCRVRRKKIKQQKLDSFCSRKKGLFKPAQILKLSVFCSKKSQVKIIQQTDVAGLDSVQKENKSH